MSDPKRGFDPLASLFDGPDLGEFTDPGSKTTGLRPEATDPLISMRADAPLDVLKGKSEGPSPSDLPEPGLRAPPPEAEQEAAAEDALHKAALARSLAKAAIAKAQIAAQAVEEAAQAEKAHAEKAQVEKAQAEKAQAEKVQRARNEARARAAGAKAVAQAKAAALKQAQTPKRSKAATAPKGQVVSRLDGLASRARRPTSALEAARAAASAEQQARADHAQEQAQAQARALPDKVDAILRTQLRGVERLKVGKALAMDDRALLRALWKAHRARFASLGALSDVVSTTRVIHALDTVQSGQLVAAIVLTDSSDYLVWIDLASQTTIAAFRDARAWYAQAR